MSALFGGITPIRGAGQSQERSPPGQAVRFDVNPTGCDFANHMGFAVLPAKHYKVRDTGSGKRNLGVLQRGFSRKSVTVFILSPGLMKDYGVSRNQRFQEQKKQIKALPLSLRNQRMVKNFYSVPLPLTRD